MTEPKAIGVETPSPDDDVIRLQKHIEETQEQYVTSQGLLPNVYGPSPIRAAFRHYYILQLMKEATEKTYR